MTLEATNIEVLCGLLSQKPQLNVPISTSRMTVLLPIINLSLNLLPFSLIAIWARRLWR